MSRIPALILCGGLCAGCASPRPFVLDADAERVEIGYAFDPAPTLPLARTYCAAYERVPRLLQVQQNIAYYQCYKP
jgi:hypothetical protein